MQIKVIPQIELGSTQRTRVGDVLNEAICDPACQRFRFAVAYVRLSGLDRLAASIQTLLNRGGTVSGAVGIDQRITTVEALETLLKISSDSTIFHTISGFTYHPKLYITSGESEAVALTGSANLTCSGLFRNVELSTAFYFDLETQIDREIYKQFDTFMNELLNVAHPNVQPITGSTLKTLVNEGKIKREAQVREPGPVIRSKRATRVQTPIKSLFPPMRVPVAPPPLSLIPPHPTAQPSTFIMQLSLFDSSHRTGIPGTPEVLIPHEAIGFFPPLSLSGRKYPDVYFRVALNTPTGKERHRYRLWYYEERAIGTRIDEYRLRMNHDTIDLSSPGGGDLLVVNKLPSGSVPAYEVTVLSQRDARFPYYFSLCNRIAQGKRWGMK